jgi:hypothetical protein
MALTVTRRVTMLPTTEAKAVTAKMSEGARMASIGT